MPSQSDEVWIAEDNDYVRMTLSRAFKRTAPAVRAVFFRNGAELVQHFRTHRVPPQLLLLDLQMPVMSGLEALDALRAEGCCGPTPVIIFSSHENPEMVRRAHFAGAKLYLKKPDHLGGYEDVASLCACCADAIGDLPASAIPEGALNVKRALKLVEPA